MTAPCAVCSGIVERTDVPHVIRICSGCGRELHIAEPGDDGRGLRIQAGDRPVIPAGWLTISLNPLKSRAAFTRIGFEEYATHIFLDGLLADPDKYLAAETQQEEYFDRLVNAVIAPLDINNEADATAILARVQESKGSAFFWAFWGGYFLATARGAREQGDATTACWATACAERCRALLIYKEHLEEVVWMGQSAKRLLDVLQVWDANRAQSNEAFWQSVFSEHSYVLSQIFAVPVLFIQERAYVGGMKIDRGDAKFVDYLFSAESSREAILIEIKTPATKLLAGKYRRGVHPPSTELSGALLQVLNYRAELVRNLTALAESAQLRLSAFKPKCVLIIGNTDQLTDDDRRSSFELYRSAHDVEVVTYDELFRKVEILAELFRLKRSGTAEGGAAQSPPTSEGAATG